MPRLSFWRGDTILKLFLKLTFGLAQALAKLSAVLPQSCKLVSKSDGGICAPPSGFCLTRRRGDAGLAEDKVREAQGGRDIIHLIQRCEFHRTSGATAVDIIIQVTG